jgi:hypothetical protein
MPEDVSPIWHDVLTDSWRLAWNAVDPEIIQVLEPLPAGDFIVLATVITMPEIGGLGLTIRSATDPLLLFLARQVPAPSEFHAVNFEPPPTPFQLRVEYYDGLAHLSYTPYGLTTWTYIGEMDVPDPPVEAGLILSWDPGSPPVWGVLNQFRILPGRWEDIGGEFTIGAPGVIPGEPMGITISEEPVIHALVGAQFGDLEFDVGRSVRWNQWFVDQILISDVNMGTQRYWVVNWSGSFPQVEYNVTSVNFFDDPVAFRKMQFEQAKARLNLEDSDWILFCDAHEGMSCDSRSEPDDHMILPFKAYLYREITRAAGDDQIVFPFFAYLRHDHVQNVEYTSSVLLPDGSPLIVLASLGVPYYLPYQGLTRLIKVSALRSPSFDWSSIDQVQAVPDPAVKLQIVSYAYAHWHLQDIEPPLTVVPPLTSSNDDGWRQRNLISQVRPIPGLPIGTTWVAPDQDPDGERGPWGPEFTNAPVPIDPFNPVPPPVSAAAEMILVPLYDTVFRLNMRDGVWYETDQPGNTPLVWDESSQRWVPRDTGTAIATSAVRRTVST